MNEPDLQQAKQQYYSDGESWAADRAAFQKSSIRTAWTIATIAASVAFVEALALIALTPLKTVVPITLLVDRHTGYVEALKGLEPKEISADSALTQSFLVQYVIGREGFDRATINTQYHKVVLWSAQAARTDYLKEMSPNSPDNPFILNPAGQTIDAQVKSVTPMSPTSAMVRFQTIERDPSGLSLSTEDWVATINFTFSTKAMTAAERYINPLGFEVLNYRKSAETIAPSIAYNVPLSEEAQSGSPPLQESGQ